MSDKQDTAMTKNMSPNVFKKMLPPDHVTVVQMNQTKVCVMQAGTHKGSDHGVFIQRYKHCNRQRCWYQKEQL